MKINPVPMKKLALSTVLLLALMPPAFAQLNIPNADGSDGPLIVSNSMTIDLSKAITGSWSNSNSGTNVGKGIYDPTQWAVVFKYSDVVISNGATLTFSNHPTHAPVVWLISNNVAIHGPNGMLNLNGQPPTSDPNTLTEPGPGGFRGGGGPTFGTGSGFGPGGGISGLNVPKVGNYSDVYGNLQIMPLIGGSGGLGSPSGSGGSGGGAILIAASQKIIVTGTCRARGGNADGSGGASASPGAGGGIRFVADQIAVTNGSILATGGDGNAFSANGGNGRIRLEANAVNLSGSYTINPATQSVSPSPVQIFPANVSPTVSIESIITQSGQTNYAPIDPIAAMSAGNNADDITLITTNTVTIRVKTINFPTNSGSKVDICITPRNAARTTLTTQTPIPVSGEPNAAYWQVSTVLNYQPNQQHTVIQARAYR